MTNFKFKILFLLLVVILILTRFYALAWGAPFFFHPDERNIASAISQLHFPNQLNPHFFAYGTFPIYLSYIVGVFSNLFLSILNQTKGADPFLVSFDRSIIILRTISALLSVTTSLLIFQVTKKLLKNTSFLPLLLSIFSVGLIQYAHFGTFEMYLTFLSLLLFLYLVNYIKHQKTIYFKLSAITFAVLVAVKVSSVFLFPLVLLAVIIAEHKKLHFIHITLKIIAIPVLFMKRMLQLFYVTVVVFALTSPFAVFDFKAFLDSMNYESQVALGTLQVFYTGSFFNTLPMLFHLQHVLPFLLNPIITIFFVFSLFYLLLYGVLKKDAIKLFLAAFFLVLFLSNSLLFVKWTRYLLPTLPFIYIITGVALHDFFGKIKSNTLKKTVVSALILTSAIYSFSFIKTVYINQDTRLEAARFAQNNIPKESLILSEVYDLGIIPFNSNFKDIKLFNFYDLDTNLLLEKELTNDINSRDYFVVPSQRIYKSRMINSHIFPKGNAFYSSLKTQKFSKVYQTPCDIFCKIVYLGDPIFSYEETTSVFDRPTVFIYKTNK